MTSNERPMRLQWWMNEAPTVPIRPKASRAWDLFTCLGIIALLVLVGITIEVSGYTKRQAIETMWREAERRGYASRYYEGAGDLTPSWRWKEQEPPTP